jgi:hypothetical protein
VQPSDGNRFRALLAGMGRMFGQDLDSVVLDAYWLALRDWSLSDFEAACAQLMRTCRFMPRPADFAGLVKAHARTASEAWDAVLQHCKGAYRDGSGIDGGGPIDQAVAGLGGYRAVAFHDLDYLPILSRQFHERYEELRDVHETRASVPQLADHKTRSIIRHNGPRRLGDVMPRLPERQKPVAEETEPA